MLIRRIADALHRIALLGKCGSFGEGVAHARLVESIAVQITHVLGNAVSFRAEPWALADAVTHIHRPWSLGAHIRVPRAVSRPSRRGQHLAVLIGARQAAKIRTIPLAHAGYEKAHGWGRPFCLRLLREGQRRPQHTYGERS